MRRILFGLPAAALCLGALALRGNAASIPMRAPQAASASAASKLETEVIEVYRLGAGPASIQRKAGKFALLLINHSRDVNATFQLVRQSADLTPIVKLGGRGTWAATQQAALVIDEGPGVLLLQSTATGRTLCTITIGE